METFAFQLFATFHVANACGLLQLRSLHKKGQRYPLVAFAQACMGVAQLFALNFVPGMMFCPVLLVPGDFE
jgi:hypothetical protein